MSLDFSITIAGEAGEGIKVAGHIIAGIFLKNGYNAYLYVDYQSLIRGGHNFVVVRASDKEEVETCIKDIDLLIALNSESIEMHKADLKERGFFICDKNIEISQTENVIQIPAEKIVEEAGAPKIMKNTAFISAFVKAVGIDFELLKKELEERIEKGIETNLKIAKEVYDETKVLKQISRIEHNENKRLIDGNEAVALGAIDAGLDTYIAYPMTPVTGILAFLAENKKEFGIKVVQPESEIAVLNMALGASYAGNRVMVGTSGGGFALMTEALSLSAMAETPVLIVESQRMSPASGVPTYSGQGDLLFALNAGHGDFYKFTAAPGDAEEAHYFAKKLLSLSFKYQTPALLLIDKQISESSFTINKSILGKKEVEEGKIFEESEKYERYEITDDGISPLAFPGQTESLVKVTGYEHNERGITTEDPTMVKKMQEKRLLKYEKMAKEVENIESAVKVYGNVNSKKVVITWGSSKGVVKEVIEELDYKAVQILVLEPFPKDRVFAEIQNAEELIVVEQNSTAQLSQFLKQNGISIDREILKYDSRPMLREDIINPVK